MGPSGAEPARPVRRPGPEPVLVAAAAMVFVDDPARPVLTPGDAPPPPRRPAPPARRAGGGRRRAGRWVAVPGGAGGPGRADGRPGRPGRMLDGPDGPVVRRPRAGPGDHRGLRPDQGRPSRVGRPEAHRARGGPDRAHPDRPGRWCAGRASGATGPSSGCRRVAREAAAQCRRTWLPEVAPGRRPSTTWPRRTGGRPGLARPGGRAPTLDPPVVAVGPEGGWDADELARFGPGGRPRARPCCGPRRPPSPRHPPVRSAQSAWSDRLRNHAP